MAAHRMALNLLHYSLDLSRPPHLKLPLISCLKFRLGPDSGYGSCTFQAGYWWTTGWLCQGIFPFNFLCLIGTCYLSMNNILVFLVARKTTCHLLISSECGWLRNFLISTKEGLRRTRVSLCSPYFCIVLVGFGFLDDKLLNCANSCW
jgi:hypothetical protein